ncbi:MAG: LamG-like jellyroll fold domain-containing protein [Verrucomicrobiia bacterium]
MKLSGHLKKFLQQHWLAVLVLLAIVGIGATGVVLPYTQYTLQLLQTQNSGQARSLLGVTTSAASATNQTLWTPTLNGGTLNGVGGTLTGPVVTGGNFSGPGVNNGSFTNPAVFGGSFTNPTIFGGTFNNFFVAGGIFTNPAVNGGSIGGGSVQGTNTTSNTNTFSQLLDSNAVQVLSISPVVRSESVPVPYKGFNDWLLYGGDWTAAELTNQVLQTASMPGYDTVIISDGQFSGRDANGNLLANSTYLPQGLSNMVAWIHSQGIRHVGIYREFDATTLAGSPGTTIPYIEQDANYLLSCGIDYFDLQAGHLNDSNDWPTFVYCVNRFCAALGKSGQKVAVDVAGGNGFDITAPVKIPAANYFICPGVDGNGADFNYALTNTPAYPGYWVQLVHDWDCCWPYLSQTFPGHFPAQQFDIVNWSSNNMIRAGLAMDCILPKPIEMSVPMSWGNGAPDYARNAYENPLMIQIHDDPLAQPGYMLVSSNVAGGSDGTVPSGWQMLARKLQGGNLALMLLNRDSTNAATITLNFTNIGIQSTNFVSVQDVFNSTNLTTSNAFSVTLPIRDAALFYLIPNVPAPSSSGQTNVFANPLEANLFFDAPLNEGYGIYTYDRVSQINALLKSDSWGSAPVGFALFSTNYSITSGNAATNGIFLPVCPPMQITNFSFSCLFYENLNTPTNPLVAFQISDQYGTPDYILSWYPTYLAIESYRQNGDNFFNSGIPLLTNQWVQLTVVNSASFISVYTNSTLATNIANTSVGGLTNYNHGVIYCSAGGMYSGAFAHPRFWTRSLGSNEVRLLYDQTFAP